MWTAPDDGVDGVEHYCTLADSTYLPQAITMWESLRIHDPSSALWLLCMDERAYNTACELALRGIVPIPLHEVEWMYEHLLTGVKETRSHGEYCWTLTPYIIRFVLNTVTKVLAQQAADENRDPEPSRVTYVDADCMFHSSPQRMLEKFGTSDSDVMITPHAFGPEYAEMAQAGLYCVQFMTFTDAPDADRVLRDWSAQTAEWCYAVIEDGKFGDQRYLDEWPEKYGDTVYVLDDPTLTLAPWNVEYLTGPDGPNGGDLEPCMYHYHGFRWLTDHEVQLNFHYRLSAQTYERFYTPYLESLARVMERLQRTGFPLGIQEAVPGLGQRISLIIHTLRNERKTARINY